MASVSESQVEDWATVYYIGVEEATGVDIQINVLLSSLESPLICVIHGLNEGGSNKIPKVKTSGPSSGLHCRAAVQGVPNWKPRLLSDAPKAQLLL